MSNPKLKHIFLELEERNGEREYTHKSVHIINKNKDINKWADKYASDFLSGESDAQDDGYYFNGGEYCVSVFSVKEISEEDFKLLQKYL